MRKETFDFRFRSKEAGRLWLMICLFFSFFARAQEVVNLYPGEIPNAKQSAKTESFASGMFRNVTTPTLEVYLPEKGQARTGAVLIVPGGGYSVVVYQGEGIGTAKQFANAGIAAFVLKYRLPDDSVMVNKTIGPLQDAQQAIKLIRENAAKWNVDENKVGIIGFSAGGHLASTAATHFQKALVQNSKNTSLRPDFQIVVYPVISMQDSLTHSGSRRSLLGDSPSKEVVNLYSSELQVTAQTPPTYITHAADDKTVDVENSIRYFQSLRRNGVGVEMHIYPKGGHGFIFRQSDWIEPLLLWMKKNKWIQS